MPTTITLAGKTYVIPTGDEVSRGMQGPNGLSGDPTAVNPSSYGLGTASDAGLQSNTTAPIAAGGMGSPADRYFTTTPGGPQIAGLRGDNLPPDAQHGTKPVLPPHHVDSTLPPAPDPYADAMNQSIDAINAAAASEAGRINAHYDNQIASLHNSYGLASTGVQNEGNNLTRDLNALNTQGKAENAASERSVQATDAGALHNSNVANARALADLKRNGGDTSALLAAQAQASGNLRAQGAADDVYSKHLTQLQNQAMNDRVASGRVITTGSLDDLHSILNEGISQAGLQKGDSLAKIAEARMTQTASVRAQYAQAVAKVAAGKPLTAAEINATNKLAAGPNYAPAFKLVLPGAKGLSHEAAQQGQGMLDAIATGKMTPAQVYSNMKAFLLGVGANLPQNEQDLLMGAADSARRQYISVTNTAANAQKLRGALYPGKG